MPGKWVVLRCVGEALAVKGWRAVLGLVPLAEHVWGIGVLASSESRELQQTWGLSES